MHKLDGVHYAIKKINLNPARVRNIAEEGQSALDSLFTELRTLARLDHPNIVRYHTGWLEYVASSDKVGPQAPPNISPHKMLEAPWDVETSGESSSVYESPCDSRGGQVVFGSSSGENNLNSRVPGAEGLGMSPETISSMTQGPEDHQVQSGSENDVDEFSERSNLESNTKEQVMDVADKSSQEIEQSLSSTRSNSTGVQSGTQNIVDQSLLTLHIQMSLHPLTLSEFISPDSPKKPVTGAANLRHCFHTLTSIRILINILDGVEYLHSEGIVPSRLEAANIFLSAYEGQQRSVNDLEVTACKGCSYEPQETHQFLDVRIGDFGLVAYIANSADANIPSKPARKPVGTEFYRPPICPAVVSEKLDVFALGVIAFELLWSFSTRESPLHLSLFIKLFGLISQTKSSIRNGKTRDASRSQKGKLPRDFCEKVGNGGSFIEKCILGMMHAEESHRLSCKEVRAHLEEVVMALSGIEGVD